MKILVKLAVAVLLASQIGFFVSADPPCETEMDMEAAVRPANSVSIPIADETGHLVWVPRAVGGDGPGMEGLGKSPDKLAEERLWSAATLALAGPGAREISGGFQPALPQGTSIEEVRVRGEKGGFFITIPDDVLADFSAEYAQRFSDIFLGLSRNAPQILNHALEIRDPADGRFYPLDHFLPVPEPVPPKPGEADQAGQIVEATGQPPAGGQGQPAGFLTGKSVFVNPGHGWYYSSTLGRWATQRDNTNNIIEDLSNAEAVDTYLVHYLWNAGAGVYTCRERDLNQGMAVVDNGAPAYSETGTWVTVSDASAYGGSYRRASVSSGETATATFTPAMPSDGFYHVYLWYKTSTTMAADAKVTIRHTGGVTQVTLNQQRDGDTFKDLGRYYFKAGSNTATGSLTISNQSSGGGSYVAADAVRFGGGTGAEVPFGEPLASARPRYEESGPYFANFMGCPSATCGSSTVNAIPRFAAWERESWEDAVFISWHSNANTGSDRGTISFAYGSGGWDAPFDGVTGGLELRNAVHNEIINDLRAGYDASWVNLGLHTNWYGEINPSNNSEMPGALFEMAFHDNATDSLQLQNPIFRQIVSRAVYQGIVKYFATRDSVSYTLLPEPPTNLRLLNDGTGKVTVSWSAPPYDTGSGLLGHAAAGYKVYRSTDGLGFDGGVALSGVGSTTYTDSSMSPGAVYYYRVSATNAGGESFPTETLAVSVQSAQAPVLVVSGFDRLGQIQIVVTDDPYSTSNLHRGFVDKMNSYRYIIKYAQSIGAYGCAFDSCSNEAVISGQVALAPYTAVIWYCGEESTGDKTFTSTEQSLLQAYLDGGGKLFTSGSEIGWDLDYMGNGASFYNSYLKADYAGDDSGTYNIAPVSGGIFEGNPTLAFDDNTYGEYDANYPDQLATTGGSVACLSYSGGSGGTAGVQYSGTFKVVSFGFPFETITTSQAREETMADILSFFGVPAGDTISPAPVGETLLWQGAQGRWIWNPVTTDRLGGAELSAHYEVWRSSGASAPGSVIATRSQADYPDSSEPAAGCWYYRVVAVDAAGNREAPEIDAIRDNPSAIFAGTWATGTAAPGHYGADYRYRDAGGSGSNTATWSFFAGERGYYGIFIYYPQGTNRSSQSRFTVTYSGGSMTYLQNQQVNGGAWNLLGNHWLEAGNSYTVVLDDAEPGGTPMPVIIADAVRWSKVP